MTTMKDVARRANVSTATVSRVLSNAGGFSDEVRLRVELAVAETGYRPNRLARGLRRQVSSVWGLLISDIQNPFFTSLVRAVEDVANEHGYSVVLCNTDEEPAKEAHYLDVLLGEQVAGILITPEDEERTSVKNAVALGVPVIAIDRRLRSTDVDTVIVDNQRGAREAVSHLVEQGARRIAVVSGPETVTPFRERVDGYVEGLEEHGIAVDDNLILRTELHSVGAYDAVQTLFSGPNRPDAIFPVGGPLTLRTLHAIVDLGLRIPDDVLFVSFDDLPLADLLTPGLTAVKQPTYDLGRHAAQLLIERLGGYTGPPREVVLTTDFIVRGSSRRQP